MNRTVAALLYGEEQMMGSMKIRQPFPSQQVENIDPFILLHHADNIIPNDIPIKYAGVGPHPHRGFSPVTFIFKGGVHHRDSRGNDSTIYAGGTQWINAGMGLIHSERPPSDIHEIGSRMELIQLWVNTPAKYKMDQPAYFPLSANEIPSLKADDGVGSIHLIAGTLGSVIGKIPTATEVNAITIDFKMGASHYFKFPSSHNAFIYLLDGKINIDDYGIVDGFHAVLFKNDGEGFGIKALADTRALIMTGEPLNEMVVAQGPYVMNTDIEIMEAMRDYRMGKMGILIE